jgi:hypothetical protein
VAACMLIVDTVPHGETSNSVVVTP